MKVSQYFNLNKTQHELDFVDIDYEKDIPLFLDPYFFSINEDPWSLEASAIIQSFFQFVIDLIIADKINDAEKLFYHLAEPNETCLGLSKSKPNGRGVGNLQAKQIFESLLESKAVKSGLVEHLEDCKIFVKGIGKDKVSDMVTNILKKHLIDYTKSQCKLWDIPLISNVPTGYYWNKINKRWEATYGEYLIIENKKILLLPKGRVSRSDQYSPEKYYNDFILNYLQNEHLIMNSVLVNYRKNGTKYVNKKDIKEKEAPYTMEYLIQFTTNHPEIFNDFRKTIGRTMKPVKNNDLEEIKLKEIVEYLILKLTKIPYGDNDASIYHKAMTGILELMFYPDLICPKGEQKIHQGRKRIDITFDNAAKTGFFHELHDITKIPCSYIFIECKNYSKDPSNPELDQLSGRFSINRGKFGLLVCRKFENLKLFLNRCSDTYKDDRGLIIPLEDLDILKLLEFIKNEDSYPIAIFFRNRMREIILN